MLHELIGLGLVGLAASKTAWRNEGGIWVRKVSGGSLSVAYQREQPVGWEIAYVPDTRGGTFLFLNAGIRTAKRARKQADAIWKRYKREILAAQPN